MNPPFLSIITVTFNAEATIERTLKSVEEQTYRGFIEHLIIDGASTDKTLSICEAYKKRNSVTDVTIVSEPDKGLYDAMNKGLRLAKGEFVCFLNAGDKLHDPKTIEDVFDGLDNPDGIGVIYGDTHIVDNEGRFLRFRHLNAPETLTWKSFKHGMLVCHQSFYARRELCVPFDTRFRFSADVDWCIKVMKGGCAKNLKNHNTQMVLTDYLDSGMTTQNHKASLLERFRVMTRHYGLPSTLCHHFLFLFRQKK
jgi:glycosyltransferase involved in cell wall biosynthesis